MRIKLAPLPTGSNKTLLQALFALHQIDCSFQPYGIIDLPHTLPAEFASLKKELHQFGFIVEEHAHLKNPTLF